MIYDFAGLSWCQSQVRVGSPGKPTALTGGNPAARYRKMRKSWQVEHWNGKWPDNCRSICPTPVTARPRSYDAMSRRLNTRMPDNDARIDFSGTAELRKWPSVDKQRRQRLALRCGPYLIGEGGTLDECIQQFIHLPEAQRHLYEIHTAAQSDLVTAILSTEHIVELAHTGSDVWADPQLTMKRASTSRLPKRYVAMTSDVEIGRRRPSTILRHLRLPQSSGTFALWPVDRQWGGRMSERAAWKATH